MGRVCATIVVVEKQKLLHILSVFVAIVIQHATRMRHIVICGLPGSTAFFPHYLVKARFSKKKKKSY